MQQPAAHSPQDTSQASPAPASSCIDYFAEYRARLRVIQVFLACSAWPKASGSLDLKVGSDDPRKAIIRMRPWPIGSRKDLSEMEYAIRLPAPAAAQTVDLDVSSLNGEHSFKLQAIPNPEAENNQLTPIRPPLSAQELESLRPTSFSCASCDNHLADLPHNVTYRNLPSAHWREIADAWLCHPKGGDDFTERYSKKMEEGFWPSDKVVLVGLWEIWVDGSAMQADAVDRVNEVSTSLGTIIFIISTRFGHPKKVTAHLLESAHPSGIEMAS